MQGWLACCFQSLHQTLSLLLPVWPEQKPQLRGLRELGQGWPRAFWAPLSSRLTRRAGTSNNTHIPKPGTRTRGFCSPNAPPSGHQPVPSSRGAEWCLRHTSFCLDFLLHHHLLSSYHSQRRFTPHQSLSQPAQCPHCSCSTSQPGQGDAAVPTTAACCAFASPVPRAARGEHHAAQKGGWTPARCWALRRHHQSFLWSCQAARRNQLHRGEPTQGSSRV